MADPSLTMRARITGDLADIKAGLNSLRGDFDKLKRDSARSLDGLDGAQGKLRNFVSGAKAAVLAVSAAVGAAGLAVKAAMDRADEMGEIAASIGIGTEALSKLAFGAQFSGVTLEQLKVGLVLFQRELLKNEGLLGQLGVQARDAAGNFRPLEGILLDLADVFAQLPDGPERTALAVKLFGRSGADLIPVLQEGSAKLAEYGEQAAATGNVITEEAAAAAGAFNDNLDLLKNTLAGVANETVKHVLPAIQGYAADAAEAGQQSNFAAEAGEFLGKALKVVATGAIVVKNLVEAAVNVLLFLGDAAVGTAKALSGNLAGAFRVLANAWTTLKDEGPVAALKRYQSEAAAFVNQEVSEITGLPDRIRRGLAAMSEGVAESQRDVQLAISNMFGPVEDAAAAARGQVKAAGDEAGATSDKAKGLLQTLRDLLGPTTGGGSSGAQKKAEALRRELERLEEQSKRALEKLREEEIKREQELQQQLDEAETELLRSMGRTAEASFREIEARYGELLQRLRANGNAAGVAIVEQLINVKQVQAKLDEFRAKMQEVTSALSTGETAFGAQAAGGLIGQVEAERQVNDLRNRSLEQLRQLRDAVSAYYTATKDPSVLAFLQELDGTIGQVHSTAQTMRQQIADVATDALTGLFTDLVSGSKSAGDALKDFVRNFAAGMAQIAARALATYLVLQLLDAIYPGLGKATAAGMSAGVKHGGGIAGEGGTIRSVDPMMFGAAPRYHSGGIAGLAPNEVPAILQRGEEVLTKSDPRHVRNGGGAAGEQVVRNIVVFSEDDLANALAGAAGEKVMVTHARNNRTAINS